jgi:hypothetical protein
LKVQSELHILKTGKRMNLFGIRKKNRGIDDSLVKEIVRHILTVVQQDKIILFGSAATEP